MNTLEISGGIPLSGTLSAVGNKNAVLPMIAASLLTREEVVLENVPDIDDVRTMIAIVGRFGVHVDWDPEQRRLQLCADDLQEGRVADDLCRRIRASILMVAPLLVRLGTATIGPPGGDVIGCRRLDPHFYGLRKLGAELDLGLPFRFQAKEGLSGADMFLSEASVTATEQIMMAAACARGKTVLRNAACEPHVTDLASMLNDMGADIRGVGSNVLEIHGVPALGGTTHRVISDYTEVGSFLALGAATGGDVTITGIDYTHYWMVNRVFERLGIDLEFPDRGTVRVRRHRETSIRPAHGGGMPVIDDGPWPQFPSDLMSVMIVLATQIHGNILFFEKMYEGRMYFVDRLIAMGANTVICDPHRVVVCGPSTLKGIELSSPDIRAGIALVGAALCADGTSVIRNVHLIDRGYEDIAGRLRSLGAHVLRHP